MNGNKINLKECLIINIHSFQVNDIAKQVLSNQYLPELIAYAFDKDDLISKRAMWVVSHCDDLDKSCLKPYLSKFILNLKNKNLNDASMRTTLRLFQSRPIPPKYSSFMLDTCYSYIKQPSMAIAIRAFAITVIYNISKPYPELLNELKMTLTEMEKHDDSKGMKSKVKNTLSLISKTTKN